MHKTNEKLNTLKWFGIVTMTIDHIGAILFPEVFILRLIGRLAMPCFLYSVYMGTKRTRNHTRYVLRLLALGILSSFVTHIPFNILFLFVLFSLSLKYKWFIVPGLFLSYFVDYGVYGFVLGWVIVSLIEKEASTGYVYGLIATLLLSNLAQLFALPMLWVIKKDWTISLPVGPKWFFYVYYPAHLLVLRLLAEQNILQHILNRL